MAMSSSAVYASAPLEGINRDKSSGPSAAMQKICLRLQLMEVLEGLTRLASYRQSLCLASRLDSTAAALFERQWQGLVQPLQNRLEALWPLVAESESFDTGRVQLNALFEVLENTRAGTERQARLLWQLCPSPVGQEVQSALAEMAPLALLEKDPQRLFTIGQGSATSAIELPEALVESLPVLAMDAPLRWLGLLRSYSSALAQQHAPQWVSVPVNSGNKNSAERDTPASERLLNTLLPHLISLRMVGPAYYSFLLSETLLHRQSNILIQVEPLLFYALNFFNQTDKQTVLMHEALERSLSLYQNSSGTNAKDEPDELLPHSGWLTELLQKIELVVPDSLAFTQKQQQRARALVDRLRQNLPVSASSPYPLALQQESLANLLQHSTAQQQVTADTQALQTAFQHLTELPHTATEIINAGWLYRLEMLPVWLESLLSPGAGGKAANLESRLLGFGPRLSQLDAQLAKSLELARLHRVLCPSTAL